MQWFGKTAADFLDLHKHFLKIYFYLFSLQPLTNGGLSVILYLMRDNKKQLEIIDNHFNNVRARFEKADEEKKARREAAFEVAFPTLFAGVVIGMIIADLLLR